jgi:hypothetical protein
MLAPELVDSFINRVLAIAIPFLISFLAYFCMALYLKLNEAVYFLNLLRGFVKWR